MFVVIRLSLFLRTIRLTVGPDFVNLKIKYSCTVILIVCTNEIFVYHTNFPQTSDNNICEHKCPRPTHLMLSD
ncbi:17394_t:CDS:1, partial [Gigaspora margarita]